MKNFISINYNRVKNNGNLSKRYKNINIRIKKLENDINTRSFDTKSDKNKSFKIYDNNNKFISDEFIERFENSCLGTYNNIESRKALKKRLIEKKYLNRTSNYNNIILKKKNIISNLNSINSDEINNISSINKIKKKSLIYSFDSAFSKRSHKDNNKKKKTLITSKKYLNNLYYKFEIIQKRKEIEKLKNENEEIIKKIKDIILLNKKLENKIIIEENKPKLIDDIALFLMNNNYLNNYPEIENNSYKENSILNIMDLGYCFENKKLINEFFDGLKKLLKIDDNVNNYNIITKLKELINIKNNYINEKNKFKNLFNANQKYFEYVQSLLNKFQINDISLLSDYIKKMYIKNIKESYTMKKIKVNLMKDMRAKKPTYLQKNKNDEIYNSNTERKTKFENSKKHYKKKTITFRNKIRYLSDANNSYFSDNQYYTQNNYDINFKLDNSSGYTICSNGKDKIIRVNKREINKDKQKNQKNLIEKIKSNKINNIIELDRINNSKKLGHSFELI